MSISYTELLEKDWKVIAKNRAYDNPDDSPDPILIEQKSISFPLWIKDQIPDPRSGWIAGISFVDCVFYDYVDLGARLSTRGIAFTRCTFYSKVTIEQLAENTIGEGCYFTKGLEISRVDNDLVFEDVEIQESLILASTPKGRILLKHCNLKTSQNKCSVTFSGKCQVITIIDCTFREISFSNCEVSEGLVINSAIIGEFDTYNLLVPRLSISECRLGKVIVRAVARIGESIEILNNIGISHLNIDLSVFNSTAVSFTKIKKFRISGHQKKDTSTEIIEVKVIQLYLERITNDGSVSFRRVIVPSGGKIALHSCNLGKCDFILCNFRKATLDFFSSKMTEVFLSETEFPKIITSGWKQNFPQSQLAFGQISTAFQKQGDTVRALEYQAREIESHFDQLSYFDKEEGKLSFTKISLWLNKWSNDFGRSWQRGILFSITCGVIFFFALVDSTEEFQFLKSFSYDSDLFIAYLRFMNPLRFFELESIFKIHQDDAFLTLTPWSYFWDFLGRVFIAYGFYQTIQAFRRYGRK